MCLYVVQCVLDNVVLGNEIFQLAAVGVLLNALCNDTEAVQVDLLVLGVLKVVPNNTTTQCLIEVRLYYSAL